MVNITISLVTKMPGKDCTPYQANTNRTVSAVPQAETEFYDEIFTKTKQ